MKFIKGLFITAIILFLGYVSVANAQSIFDKPVIENVEKEDRESFQERFESVKWTGAGLNNPTAIDYIPTIELRSRLQQQFGNPTQKLKDLIENEDFRPGMYIQFEYWFTVNDSIPMMVLDVVWPFSKGLTYVGASRYIDLMPSVKREFTAQLMQVKEMAEYEDYFYSPENDRLSWYYVAYKNGEFFNEKLEEEPDEFRGLTN